MRLTVTDGDLLDQEVAVIVNAWNRNVIPWWLLWPQGVSGAIKRRGGYQPFRELARLGPIPAGGAVVTGAGRLPFRAIIHVAGINLFWLTSESILRRCITSALHLAQKHGFRSIAFPLIGCGTGGFPPDRAESILCDQARACAYEGEVKIVRYAAKSPASTR
jgi:O-acetyl-ADP-ribose deacetylase (regulator of RNase III)